MSECNDPTVMRISISRAVNGWIVELEAEDDEGDCHSTLVFISPGEMLDKLASLLIKRDNIVDFQRKENGQNEKNNR